MAETGPAEPAPAAPAPAPAAASPASPEDEWIQRVVFRRGIPAVAAVGWTIAVLGLVLVAYAYSRSVGASTPYAVGAARVDILGAAVFLLGLILAATFHFVPGRRAVGIEPSAPKEELQQAVRDTNGQVLLSQILVGVGLGLTMVGIAWMALWLYNSYQEGSVLSSVIRNYQMPTHYLGAIPLFVGLLILFFFWGRVGMTRTARNFAVVSLLRAPAASGPAVLPSGITEAEVHNLMKRLDGLMAQLPDQTVTEFSRTPEADTYLKLLGS